MSIHKRSDRAGYQVKWREGGRQHSRTFTRKGDAETFERDVDRRRQLGPLAAGVIMKTLRFVGRLRLSRWKPPPLGGGGSRARTVWGGF